jgi:ATP-dependent Clp protease ATP-binding subunit ClpB
VHLAVAFLNETSAGGAVPGGITDNSNNSLFASVIQKAGGDVVCFLVLHIFFLPLCSTNIAQTAARRAIQKLLVRLPTQSPPPDEVTPSGATLKIFREAQSLQKTMHDSYIAQDHILLALIKDPSINPVLKEAGLTEAALKTAIEQTRGNRRVESKSAEAGFDALSKYATDLTALAEEGKIDPVIGRDNEIRRVIRILCRR